MSIVRNVILTLLLLFTSSALTAPVTAPVPCAEMVYKGEFPTAPAKEKLTRLCHKSFVVGFSTARKTPLWVAEVLTMQDVTAEAVERDDDFRPDPLVAANLQSSPKAYVGSGFDKGHMNNYADVADDPVAASESFFMTNIVPQKAQNNRGIWRSLEIHVRKVAKSDQLIYVVTGVIFDGEVVKLKDGTPIPTRLYKVILVPKTKKIYTFIIPNANGLPASTLLTYATTLRNLRITDPIVNAIPNPPKGYVDIKGFE